MPTPDPIERFCRALDEATKTEPFDATACTLATSDRSGRPAARTVLLKRVDARGFCFFTNLGSRKAHELEDNPRAALCVYWASRGEQVRIEGTVVRVPDEEADAYFATRPRGSQLGAWASRQSEALASREALLGNYDEAGRRFEGKPIPRPPFWGGYCLVPELIEFWQSRDNRLHDRLAYRRAEDGWAQERLYP